MDSYIKYLIFVGLFVTIVTIILFFVMYNYSDSKSQWPPESNTCPDYWTIHNDPTNGPTCYDTLRMSPNDEKGAVFNPNTVSMDQDGSVQEWGGFPSNGSSISYVDACSDTSEKQVYIRDGETTHFGSSSEWGTHCGKRKWAKDNGVTWDGITNSNIDCSSYLGSESGDTLLSI